MWLFHYKVSSLQYGEHSYISRRKFVVKDSFWMFETLWNEYCKISWLTFPRSLHKSIYSFKWNIWCVYFNPYNIIIRTIFAVMFPARPSPTSRPPLQCWRPPTRWALPAGQWTTTTPPTTGPTARVTGLANLTSTEGDDRPPSSSPRVRELD